MLLDYRLLVVVVAVCVLWAEHTSGQQGNPRRRRPGARRPGGPRSRPNAANAAATRQGDGPGAGRQGVGAGPATRRQGGGPNARRQGGGPTARGQGTGPGARRQGSGPGGGRQGARNGAGRQTGPRQGAGGPRRFCQKIMVPMCKGQVGYAFTRLPNQYGHRTQSEVMEALEPFWPFMDMDCSPNFRLTACSAYLPKCVERRRLVMPPCRQSCMRAKRQCRSAFATYKKQWPAQFNCTQFPRLVKNRLGVCVPPAKRAPTEPLDETACVTNTVPLCRNLSYFQAFIPNMFWQSSLPLISQELSQYQDLVDTGCNPNIAFFLCGIYLPYCQDTATEFAVPCREVCEQVRADCEDDLMRVYGIHWPGKLQCHRYPASSNDIQQCVYPNATEIMRLPDPEDEDYPEEEE